MSLHLVIVFMIFLDQNFWIGVPVNMWVIINEGLDITIYVWMWTFYFKTTHTTAWKCSYTIRWGSYIWPACIHYKPWCFYREVLMFFRDNINIGSLGLILLHASPISSNTSEFIFITNFLNQGFSWILLICPASIFHDWCIYLTCLQEEPFCAVVLVTCFFFSFCSFFLQNF